MKPTEHFKYLLLRYRYRKGVTYELVRRALVYLYLGRRSEAATCLK